MKRALAFGFSSLVAVALPSLAAAAPADETPSASTDAAMEKPSVSSLEVSGVFGPSFMFGEAANPEYMRTYSQTGAYGELGFGYRSSYFLDPFLSVGYATLASGEARLPAGPYGAGGSLGMHLGTWIISPGITLDLWRFRPRFALGIAVVVQSFEFRGERHSSTQTPLANQFGLGFNAFDDDRFRLDLEARLISAQGADITFMTFDAVLRGDVLYFVSR
jgi:hypothetical protein